MNPDTTAPRYLLRWCITTYTDGWYEGKRHRVPGDPHWHVMSFDTLSEVRAYYRDLAKTEAFCIVSERTSEDPRHFGLFDLDAMVRVKLPAWRPILRYAVTRKRRENAEWEAQKAERQRSEKLAELARLKRELGEP